MIFYYSGCGNSRFVAQHIAQALEERLVFIPEAERAGQFTYTLAENERVGFVYPIYSWRPPKLVSDFVKKLRFEGTPSYVYTAVTAGDNAGMAEALFRTQLQEIGLNLNAAFLFVMPNTYINMVGMTVDSERVAQRKIAKTKKLLPEAIENIKVRKSVSTMIKGMFPRIKTYSIGKSFYKWVSDKPFFATDDCIGCGKCVQVCPLQNIALEEGKPRWNGHCTNCDACYHYCPKHAIQFGTKSKGKGQYHFPE